MISDEERSPTSDHGVELQNEHSVEIVTEAHELSLARRRSVATIAVAVCLGLAGIMIGITMVRGQRLSDEHATREVLEREELREGWKALGAAAAVDAQNAAAQAEAASLPPASPSAAPVSTAPATNVVVINVPSSQPAPTPQPAAQQPTSIVFTAPPAPALSSVVPTQSYLAPTYVPVPNVALPGPSDAALPGQSVGNGTIPGSSPNPALPNGAAAPAPTPPSNATPSTPVGTVPVSP